MDRHDELGDVPAIHLGEEEQPLALAAERIQSPSIRSLQEFRLQINKSDLEQRVLPAVSVPRDDPSNPLLTFVQSSSRTAIATSQTLEQIVGKYETNVVYPESGLGRKLLAIARLIASGLNTHVYYVTLDGFDTHSNQGEAHSRLLRELSDAVVAFTKDLDQNGHGARVLSLVFSEFGRRLKENASHGTDHGAAAPVFLAGGKVKSGPIGPYPSLTNLADGDLKLHTDYRRIYATILEKWFRVDSMAILGDRFTPLDFLK